MGGTGMNAKMRIELDELQLKRPRKIAREAGQTPDGTLATLIEEGLRRREFPGIDFRDTEAGRQVFVPGIRLPVYFLAMLAREVDDDVATIAAYYDISASTVQVSLDYIQAFASEIDRDITELEAAEERLVASLSPERIVTIP